MVWGFMMVRGKPYGPYRVVRVEWMDGTVREYRCNNIKVDAELTLSIDYWPSTSDKDVEVVSCIPMVNVREWRLVSDAD
jgi:hypothetical protein